MSFYNNDDDDDYVRRSGGLPGSYTGAYDDNDAYQPTSGLGGRYASGLDDDRYNSTLGGGRYDSGLDSGIGQVTDDFDDPRYGLDGRGVGGLDRGGLDSYDNLDRGLGNLSLDTQGLGDQYYPGRDPYDKLDTGYSSSLADDGIFNIPEADSSYLGSPLAHGAGYGTGGLADQYHDPPGSLGAAGTTLLDRGAGIGSDPYDDGLGRSPYDHVGSTALGDNLGGSYDDFGTNPLGTSRSLQGDALTGAYGLDNDPIALNRSYDDAYDLNDAGASSLGSRGFDDAYGLNTSAQRGGLASSMSNLDNAYGIGDGCDGLGSGLAGTASVGLTNLDNSLSPAASGLGYDPSLHISDYAAGPGSGWQTYDSGLDFIGADLSRQMSDVNADLHSLDRSDLLQDAALGLGGAAIGAGLGAAAMHAYDKRSHANDLQFISGYGYDTRGVGDLGTGGIGGYANLSLGGHGAIGRAGDYYGSNYGNSMMDRDLGLLGSSAFGHSSYDGFNSSLSGLDLQYSSLANYENSLYSNNRINQVERESLLRDRLAFEALDDATRRTTWDSYSPSMRDRLGLNTGYWGNRLGGMSYDPSYEAFGYSTSHLGHGAPYYGTSYSVGYGDPSFYSNNFSSFGRSHYDLTPSVRSYYSDYLGPSATHNASTLPYFTDDLRFRGAADLAYYQQVLSNDRALDEAERLRRWQQRLDWERLDNDARRLRWQEMNEIERERLGLAAIGSYYGGMYAGSGQGLSLAYDLPPTLRNTFQPYMARSSIANSAYIDPDYVRYNELAAYSNALKYDRQIAEEERLRRWKNRLLFEQMDDIERRTRWSNMPYAERAALGLAGGFYDARYGVSQILDPSALRPMKCPVSSTLAQIYRPYQSKRRLLERLQAGAEDAAAFAELAAFENALRADSRLREEDKLRRWKARVRWQELNERERRRRFYLMQESERRMLGLGLSSYWGRRYGAPLMLNGTRGLPPPRSSLPRLRQPLPAALQERFRPVLARQPALSTSSVSRSLVGPDPVKNLADRIRLSIAQKKETMPGASQAQRLAATEEKRRILREMDADRRGNAALQVTEDERLRRLRALGQ